mgnify:FL=1|jgi:hypothetical protein
MVDRHSMTSTVPARSIARSGASTAESGRTLRERTSRMKGRARARTSMATIQLNPPMSSTGLTSSTGPAPPSIVTNRFERPPDESIRGVVEGCACAGALVCGIAKPNADRIFQENDRHTTESTTNGAEDHHHQGPTHSADRCTPSGCDRYREGYSRLRVIVINEFIQLRRELPGHSIRIGYLPVII